MAKNRLIRVIECGGRLLDVKWSPDGTRLAITRHSGPMEVLTTEGRRLWANGPGGRRFAICWSPDGRGLAAVHQYDSGPTGAEIFNAATGETLRTFEHPDRVQALDWSRSGSLLATGSDDGWVRLWSPVTGAEVARSSEKSDVIWSVAFSPDGQWVAVGSRDNIVRIWNARTGALAHRLEGHRSSILRLAWSPDGRRLASPSGDNTIRIWETATGQCVRVLEGHSDWANAVDWSGDGRLLASSSADHTLRLWWLDEECETMILEGHGGDVWSVVFSPEGGRLASCSDDGTIRLWSVEDLVQPIVSRSVPSALSDFVRRQAATVGRCVGGSVPDLWVPTLEGAQGDCLGEIRLEGRSPECAVALSPDGKSLVVGSTAGHVKCLDLVDGQNRWTDSQQLSRNVLDLSYSPDGSQIALASYQSLRIWDAATGRRLTICGGHETWVLAVRWSPDGRQIASAGYATEEVRIWEAETGRCLRTLGHRDTRSIDWSPDGRYLVSGGYGDHLLCIWDASSGHQLRELRLHDDPVNYIAWAPTAPDRVASASRDKTVRVWDPHTGAELHRLQHTSHVYVVAWSPDGRFLASGGVDESIRIWDATSGQELARFAAEGETIFRLAWSRSGAFLASSQFGNLFRLWDTRRFAVSRGVSGELNREFTRTAAIGRQLPVDPAALPRAWAALHRLGRSAPLSLTRDLLQLTGGQPSGLSADLAAEPGVRRLAQLKWPTSARVGLAGLLLKEARFEGWEPPEDSGTGEVASALQSALASGEPMPPELPEETWLAPMRHAARQIDERLVNLLRILGPDAVTADPGLPLRLWPRVGQLPALSVAQQRLLGRSLSLGGDGRTSGSGGGTERTGIDHRGELTRLLPSQWALPRSLVQFRYVRQELLYRSREGSETPRLRPVVLVLDVSPPVYGAVEAVTRLAADTVARSLRQAGVGVMLVTTGSQSGGEVLLRLEQPAHCVEIWTQRTRAMARAARTLKLAGTVRSQLREGELEPVILVLSHPWFGSEEEAPRLSGLRGLFVQYPKYQVRPVLADRCERWHSIAAGETTHLLRYLGELVG